MRERRARVPLKEHTRHFAGRRCSSLPRRPCGSGEGGAGVYRGVKDEGVDPGRGEGVVGVHVSAHALLLHRRRLEEVEARLHHVEFHQPTLPRLPLGQRGHFLSTHAPTRQANNKLRACACFCIVPVSTRCTSGCVCHSLSRANSQLPRAPLSRVQELSLQPHPTAVPCCAPYFYLAVQPLHVSDGHEPVVEGRS